MIGSSSIPPMVATPSADRRLWYHAESTGCICGWDIIRFIDAETPTWLHMATGRKECGVDDLKRPWSAPECF